MSKTTRTLDQRNPPRLVNEMMEHSGHSALNESKIPLEPHGETQLDFFHKLGYSTEQVQDVLHKFGLHTDTNRLTDRVLGELVRAGASPEDKEVTIMSVLVSRSLQEEQSMSLSREDGDALRPIVIDGSNVAMSHGNKEVFSCLGIQLAVSYFLERGHTDVTVFVPSWRKEQPRPDVPITDQHILRNLERKKCLVFTPSRRVAGKRVVCYDDRFIVKLAYGSDGIIVSNDTFRDLQGENPDWKRFIEERLLMYSFVNDKFMPPDDPLGRHGPTLDNFLRKVPRTPKKQLCPYGKKCTYGIKCKFHHPDRANHSHCCLADELREKARQSSSAHKHCLLGSRPVTANGLSLEEAMAQKLTLEQWRGSLKKGHTSENVVLIKGGRRSSRRPPSRKEKASKHFPSDLDSLFSSGSQEQLDSGLGSIDNAPIETFWYPADNGYGASYRSFHPNSSPRSLQCEATVPLNVHDIGSPKSTPCPCSCCSHVPSSSWATAGFHPHSQHQSRGLAGTHHPDMIAYTPAHYYGYGASVYPVSMHAYSHPAEFQHSRAQDSLHRAYWSDPFQGYPQAVSRMSGEKPLFEPSHMTQPGPCGKEREDVRKKLLAIFNACLVDKAMDMFPQLMDPQMLAAEILMLQSQGRPLK